MASHILDQSYCCRRHQREKGLTSNVVDFYFDFMLKEQKHAFVKEIYGLLPGFVGWEEMLDNNINQDKFGLHH